MIFLFDFRNYFHMIRLAWNESNPMVRRYYLVVLLVWVPVVSTFHAFCFFLDGLFFPGLHRVKIKEPVFVVGHARSGTTLVHRLMSRDEGRFSSFCLYELYFPSLLQKKVIRFVARLDAEYFGEFLGKRVRAWEEKRYASTRDAHEMGLTQPEEDDIVFYYSMASGFWITKMPYMGDLDFYYVDEWEKRKRDRLMRFYKDCIRRQLYLNGPEKIHLSKNPVFSGRVKTLIEAFPDARIVVPIRNPYETIPSLLKLMKRGWKRLDWDEAKQKRCLDFLANQSFHTYTHPLDVLAQHPETRRAEIDYREVVEDPAGGIRRAYVQLGLPLSDAYEKVLQEESSRARKHASGHAYSLEEFGLESSLIRQRLSALFERYQWDEGDGPGADG